MISAEPLPNEEARLAALFRQELLDTPEEEDLNNLVKLAAQLCGSDISLISLVDNHRQWFKASHGLEAKETPKEFAFCAHAIHGDDLFEIPNALEDERFADNPFVAGDPHIRSYAGQPLRSPDGYKLGTFCVINRTPKVLTPEQREVLALLTKQAERYLELRYRIHKMNRSMKVIQAQAYALEQVNQVKDQLIAVLSHDLRSPIASLEGIVEAFDQDCLSAEDVVTLLQELRPQVKQTTTQLSQVLRWAEQQMHHENVVMKPLSMAAIAPKTLQWVKERAKTKQISLILDVDETLWALGDEALVDLVLRNLLGNAIKYSRRGDRVVLFARKQGDYVQLGVQDHGLGMEPKTLKKLRNFQYQFSSPGTENEQGTGLGLLLCQTYLQKMHTSLDIESTWKQGATFAFRLAIAPQESADQ
ncbi:MAG: GAF domain-containing sensor histidine kinase [Limnothrix sp. RL_2_0]|nr:GAF domain-containing sensor histidine kinase [Limnothrix sp. RL_2_0]